MASNAPFVCSIGLPQHSEELFGNASDFLPFPSHAKGGSFHLRRRCPLGLLKRVCPDVSERIETAPFSLTMRAVRRESSYYSVIYQGFSSPSQRQCHLGMDTLGLSSVPQRGLLTAGLRQPLRVPALRCLWPAVWLPSVTLILRDKEQSTIHLPPEGVLL